MSGATRDFAVGELSFRVETDTGHVRNVRFRGHEIVRGIYPAVRNPQWATLRPQVAPPRVEASPDRVCIELDGRVDDPAAGVAWRARIEADARPTLRYHWRAEVFRDTSTNRTGLCVLHPAEAAGAACTIEHPNGRTTTGQFPAEIAPHQPFHDIRAITHAFTPGGEASVRCEGEVFEMEDQRNWTDASFKTYCRPLDWPRPYPLAPGAVVEHTVTVTVRGQPAPRRGSEGITRLAPTPQPVRWPRIGFGLRAPLPAALRDRARQLRPAHVRVETTPEALPETLRWAAPEAAALDCDLELALSGADATPPTRSLLPPRCFVALFDVAGNPVTPAIVDAWLRAGFDAAGTGSLHHFTELNRVRPPANSAHRFTTFGINAQVHAFDDTSMLETLSQHNVVARQAASFAPDRPVHVSPIVLGPARESGDARLHSEFGALWTLGSLARLGSPARERGDTTTPKSPAAHGAGYTPGAASVDRLTYFELHGPAGILRENAGPSPLENLFVQLAAAQRIEFLPVGHGDASALDALLLHSANGRRLIIAHHGEQPLELAPGFGLGPIRLAPRSVREIPLPA